MKAVEIPYKDHLGNKRMSYTLNPATNKVEILEENHYYPFGLTHPYNNTKRELKFDTAGNLQIIQVTEKELEYKYYYQEQERQDELNLNWDSFKYRNYDYAIGRFMSVDPLAEKYAYNSTYAFQENKMGLGRELEGLELVTRDEEENTVSGPVDLENNPDLKEINKSEKENNYIINLDAVIISDKKNNNLNKIDSDISYSDLSAAASLGKEYFINSEGKVRGKSGNYYSFNNRKGFNQYTGTKKLMKSNFMKGKTLGFVSRAFGVLEYKNIVDDYYGGYEKQTIGNHLAFGIEAGSNTITTFGKNPISFAWYIGHDILGKKGLGKLKWYNETFLPWGR